MWHRSLAFLLALSVMLTPAITVFCEMDCAHPRAASRPCHTGSSTDGSTLHGTTHACDHDHTGTTPALLTSGNGRDALGPSVASSTTTGAAEVLFPQAGPAVTAVHGPPGFSSRNRSSRITVLRI